MRAFSWRTVKRSSRGEHVGDPFGNPGNGVAHDHQVGIHGVEGASRVEDALGLLETRARRREVQNVRREALRSDLEARAGARRRLEEEVDDRPAAQGRNFLDDPLGDFPHAFRGVEDALDVVAVEVFDAE
jgi:hypothetical protein